MSRPQHWLPQLTRRIACSGAVQCCIPPRRHVTATVHASEYVDSGGWLTSACPWRPARSSPDRLPRREDNITRPDSSPYSPHRRQFLGTHSPFLVLPTTETLRSLESAHRIPSSPYIILTVYHPHRSLQVQPSTSAFCKHFTRSDIYNFWVLPGTPPPRSWAFSQTRRVFCDCKSHNDSSFSTVNGLCTSVRPH